MSRPRTFVIIGTGRAEVRAAETLRDLGFDGRVVLISEEHEYPYDRVTLSQHFLYGAPGFHGLYFHDEDFYVARGIELQLGTPVSAIGPRRGDVVLSSGQRYRYDKLLLATGAAANRWTGLPVALVGRGPLPLGKHVGPEIGEFFRTAHAIRGVDLRLGTGVAALGGTGAVENLILTDGNMVDADIVVFGIGARPRVDLAAAAGLAVGDGIVVDEYFATSAPSIFAAGDVADVPNMALGRRCRLEHYAAALVQGAKAAQSMLGIREPYSQIPFFFSDQYDIWMECTGDLTQTDDFVVRTLDAPETFIAFWLRNGRLAAGMNVNIKGVPDQIKALIAGGEPVDRGRLADPDVPLGQVTVKGTAS